LGKKKLNSKEVRPWQGNDKKKKKKRDPNQRGKNGLWGTDQGGRPEEHKTSGKKTRTDAEKKSKLGEKCKIG